MPSINENMIQSFFPNSPNPPFDVSICIGSLKRSANDMDGFGLKNGIKGSTEGTAIVVDEKIISIFPYCVILKPIA
jgi:hypothetical protein